MARLSNKLGEIVVTSNPQTAGLAGEIRPFAGDTSGWPVIDGVRQLKGWAVCEGDILEQADYPDLFANIQGTWDSFAHPDGQTGIVGAEQFRLPKLAGLYLGGAGANGDSTFALGTYADDKTSANGLNATTTVGGTSFSDTVANVHRASSTSVANFFGAGNNSNIFAGNLSSTGINNHTVGNFSISANGTTATADRNAAITGDAETRPKTAPVSYIIALYNNVANVITTKDFTADTVTSTGNVTVGGNIVGGEATASQVGTVSLNQVATTPVNHLINGGDFWQRGTIFVDVQNNDYTADRWAGRRNANATGMQIFRSGEYPVGSQIRNSIGIQKKDTGPDALRIAQQVESHRCYQLAGKKATVGLNMNTSPGATWTGAKLSIRYSTTEDQSLGTTGGTFLIEHDLTFNQDNSWLEDGFTFDVPSDCAAMVVRVEVLGGAQDDSFRIHEPRLYEGEQLYKFVRAGSTYAGELALCQRYFEKSYNINTNVGASTRDGQVDWEATSTSRMAGSLFFKVTKRTDPAFKVYSNQGVEGSVGPINTSGTIGSGFIMANVGESGSQYLINGSGITTGLHYGFQWTADAEL